MFIEDILFANYAAFDENDEAISVHLAGITYPDSTYHLCRRTTEDYLYSFYVFEYVLSGKGYINCNGRHYTVCAGDTYIIHKKFPHEYYADPKDPFHKVWVNIGGALPEQLLKAYRLDVPVTIVKLNTQGLFGQMHQILQEYEDASLRNEQMSLLLHKLLIQISGPKNRRNEKTTIEQLKDYLDNHPFDKITLDKLVQDFFMSKSQIIRLFKKHYGITPYAYLLQNKIAVAKTLLMNTNMSIKAISEKLCFSDEHYFSKEFKKAEMVSPKVFRNRYHETR